jgi:hypothetical protein
MGTDFKRENRYDSLEPERPWSVNVVLGMIYGESFGKSGERTVRYEVNYFNGVNPHGQCRQDRLSYLGLNFVIDSSSEQAHSSPINLAVPVGMTPICSGS